MMRQMVPCNKIPTMHYSCPTNHDLFMQKRKKKRMQFKDSFKTNNNKISETCRFWNEKATATYTHQRLHCRLFITFVCGSDFVFIIRMRKTACRLQWNAGQSLAVYIHVSNFVDIDGGKIKKLLLTAYDSCKCISSYSPYSIREYNLFIFNKNTKFAGTFFPAAHMTERRLGNCKKKKKTWGNSNRSKFNFNETIYGNFVRALYTLYRNAKRLIYSICSTFDRICISIYFYRQFTEHLLLLHSED